MIEVGESPVAEAIKLAYAAADQVKVEPTDVVEYQSEGRVLVIGSSSAISRFGELPESLSVQSLITEADISIDGALGNFSITTQSTSTKALPPIKADLIVDLSDKPLLSMPVTPPGYFYAGSVVVDPGDLKAEVAELVGTFEKPRYFAYNPDLCAHGRSGKAGCTRCLDACPTEAISSLIDRIEVDPFRCQGGGICATVCPSAAIQYSFPKAVNLMQRIRVLIKTYRESSSSRPQLVFASEAAMQQAEQRFPQSLLVTVEETASVGLEVWFSALAWGAASIVIFEPEQLPAKTREALDLHIQTAQRLLSAMGYPVNTITLLGLQEQIPEVEISDISPALHAAATDKRQAFFMAVDHLIEEADSVPEMVDLPQGAIFGSVDVNKSACTLCMACVSSCPGNALQDGRQLPQLGFIEAKCLQCGVCVNTCPENAISISPRFMLNAESRQTVRVLNEETPFCCITCGKPFATQSGITTILDKLMNHPMFSTERSRERLKMCEDCRVKDMMEDSQVDL